MVASSACQLMPTAPSHSEGSSPDLVCILFIQMISNLNQGNDQYLSVCAKEEQGEELAIAHQRTPLFLRGDGTW